jgi:hypothetical protein
MILDGTITFSDATVQNSSSNTHSLGIGQTWQTVTGSRTASTTYYNTTGKPIIVSVYTSGSPAPSATLTVSGLNIGRREVQGVNDGFTTEGVVPPGASYSYTGGINNWYELR